jgi:hypothetical protein
MPSAIPLPRGPSRLALFGAEDLLRPTGCPICGYVAEAGDRFMGWFALEAHADPGMTTRLRESLGCCPAHTRELLGQPGADGRLTAVYRYLMQAALAYLADGTSPRAPCPACAHGTEAEQRALDTLLTGLREEDVRDRYRDAAGLCLPHLRAAAARGGRRLAAWLAGDMSSRLAAGPPGLAVIAGDAGADAEIRVRLRTALPASSAFRVQTGSPPDVPGTDDVCPVCLTAAGAERDVLAGAAGAAARGRALDPSWAGACPAHLHEMSEGTAGGPEPMSAAGMVLVLQAERSRAWLAGLPSPAGWRSAFSPLAGRRHGPRGRGGQGACPACQAWHNAASSAAGRLLEIRQAPPAASAGAQVPGLCLRHLVSLRRQDPRNADAAIRVAARRAESLMRELEEAFRKRAWAHRHEPRGQEMTAWRRAAALVDGRVYGGGPPGPL